ncbi:MAG: calcium-binding protein [Myxococcales bacterium]|nr:calcium-binding protein [Myxococcales bacterium]
MLTRTLRVLAAVSVALSVVACDEKEPTPDSAAELDGEGAEAGEPAEAGPAEAVACAGLEPEQCRTADGDPGLSYCVDADGEQVWTGCFTEGEACIGESWSMGCFGEYCVYDAEEDRFYMHAWQVDYECATPLVLSFDAAPVTFSAGEASPVFAFDDATAGCATDWPDAPWLALDRDGDGHIAGGRELFGSGTRLAGGGTAAHGFEALAELDADGDGTISAADPRFSELVLWSDHDGDRAGTPGEQASLEGVGLVAIHLDFHRRGECDERGNCGRERAAFEFRGADGAYRVGEVVDVYLACQ